MKKIHIFKLLLVIILINFLDCEQDRIIAKVGKYTIRKSEFNKFLLHYVSHVNQFATHKQRLHHLNRLIDEKLKLIDAYRHNLDQDAELLTRLKYYEKKAVLQYVRDKEIIEKVIPDELIKDLYNKQHDPQQRFDEMKDELRRHFFIEKQAELQQQERELIQRVRNHFNAQYNLKNMEFLISFIQKIHQTNTYDRTEPISTLLPKLLDENEQQKVLIDFKDEKYTIENFLAAEGKLLTLGSVSLRTTRDLEEFLAPLMSDEQLLIRWGYEQKYHQAKKIKEYLAETKESLIIHQIERKTIDEQFVEPDESEIENYYLEHQRNYFFPEKRKVQDIFVRDKNLAQQLYERAKANEGFDRLAATYNERKLTQRTNGMIGFISADQHGLIGEKAASMEVGEISEPFKIRDGYSIIKVLEIMPKRQKTFLDAKREAERDLITSITQSIRRAWLDDLRIRVKVEIYEDNLREAFADSW